MKTCCKLDKPLRFVCKFWLARPGFNFILLQATFMCRENWDWKMTTFFDLYSNCALPIGGFSEATLRTQVNRIRLGNEQEGKIGFLRGQLSNLSHLSKRLWPVPWSFCANYHQRKNSIHTNYEILYSKQFSSWSFSWVSYQSSLIK